MMPKAYVSSCFHGSWPRMPGTREASAARTRTRQGTFCIRTVLTIRPVPDRSRPNACMLRTKMLVINVLRDSSQTSASAFFSGKFLLLGRAIHLLFYVFLPGSSGRWRLGNAVFDIVDIESGTNYGLS